MEQSKPLSYPSLKCVIEYMDVEFRTICAPNFPTLRNIRNTLPLRLDFLKLSESSFKLDNTHHTFRITECIKKESLPTFQMGMLQELPAVPYDLDQFESTGEVDLQPGDIVIKEEHRLGHNQNNFRMMMRDRYQDQRLRQPDAEYTSYVHYRVQNEYQLLSARSQYEVKIRDSIKKKLNEIFGGRRVHQVKHLEMGISYGALRLPEGLKLKIRELSVQENGNNVIEAIRPILDKTSFPLKSLSVEVETPQDPMFQNEILRTSESLNITLKGFSRDSWSNILISLSNSHIHISRKDVSMEDVEALARNWIENNRDIGTKFSMQCDSVTCNLVHFRIKLGAVAVMFPNKKYRQFGLYTLRMSSTSELNFYGCQSPNYGKELASENGKPWMIVMEVMPIGYAEARE